MSATRKILCAVDLSEPSRLAMIEAAELAKRFQAELALVHVATEPSSATGEVIAAPPELFEQARREAEAVLEGWRLEAEQLSGGTVEAKVLSNRRPAQGIVRFAAEGGFDLVVVATHGRTGLKHLMLGSVAERVVREAPCKVLVVRRS